MPIAFYMDHHVPKAVTMGLRLRGIDVLTAYEDNSSELEDPALLDRASALERVLVTQDEGFLAEATRCQEEGILFHGIVYAHQPLVLIGIFVQDLELIGKLGKPEEFVNRVTFLPL
jgi:predicted nuclease of predicted toxin-antitoxin system